MAQINYMTEEGLENLRKEVQEMKTKGRAEMANMIKEAREKGDLSENAEYDAAKEAQGMLEMKISQLEEMLANSRVMDTSQIDVSKVSVLTTVKVFHEKMNREIEYTLVAEKEADLKQNKISVTSPIGKGLLGKKVGETAHIEVPAGMLSMKILDIRL
ncbi:MAG: transcription elongation factor GreA [Sphingobacteriales bacterium BACL12 MAG-120813-bin55]|jgi:transcription elongation factor GreA|nr:MAG: transcription elongation factor GreA [Sphingobacteriales bacterium BACL12 MAG-120802-bin5]KRP11611.1 MAG: transcription elongation factor GreA [Sphingobacteriales bacterium BACL12 MAG-120813-bin55]